MVTVKPMVPQDVAEMAKWGVHSDLRFEGYNFPYRSQLDFLLWYRSKRKFLRKYIFSVFLEDRLIGYITYKNINWLKREGEMGIAFDPDCLSKGYGTEAIQQYLALVRTTYKAKRVWLRTAEFNLRGQRCYEKAGFKPFETRFEPYEDQTMAFELVLQFDDFDMVEDELWTRYVYMEYLFKEK